MTRRFLLTWLIRVFGGAAALALPFVFIPDSWMKAGCEWAGIGAYPGGALVDYLARSLSMFYALVGVLLLMMAGDLPRYRPFIVFVGWGSTVAGVLLLGIDLHAGMPFLWTLHEGPMSTLFGLAVVWLVRSVPDANGARLHDGKARPVREES